LSSFFRLPFDFFETGNGVSKPRRRDSGFAGTVEYEGNKFT
jgi:hypothetical protein